MRPCALVTMSPGLMARPSGMFSQAATSPTTWMGRLSSATAFIVPMTQAAPLMSNFISSMVGGSLSEMPPVSKVMPLPTSTTGAPLARAGLCSMTMKRGGSSLPCVTARKQPIFSRLISARPSTFTLSDLWVFARPSAVLPR